MNPKKTEAVKNFLTARARPELAELYNYNMEVQVNVAQGKGERVDNEYKGKKYSAWTDGLQTWKSFRVPLHANTEPAYTDFEIKFDLAAHVEGIGLTGWDWVNKKSLWVAFDFDAIVGHSDKHTQKLTDAELSSVRNAAQALPYVTVLKSTSGNGLHLYVYLEPVDTQNHNEHAAVARSILSKMSAETGFDFNSKVDNCGHVMWIWHRKFEKAGGVNGEGLKVVKQGDKLSDIPINWKDHIRVSSGKRARTIPSFIEEKEIDWFEQMCGQHVKIPLDQQHRALTDFLNRKGATWWFDSDHHMLVCHTHDLKSAHTELNLRGIFETTSSQSSDQNCFGFPLKNGAWVIRRHTPGVREHEIWDQDTSGWTRCYFNREPDLKTAAKANDGAEDDNGVFVFPDSESAVRTLKVLGTSITLADAYLKRAAFLKPHKDGRLILDITRNEDDNIKDWKGWVNKKKTWRLVINSQLPTKYEQEVGNYDDTLRHLVSVEGGDAGWSLKSEDSWKDEPLAHLKLALKALGNSAKDSDLILGQAVLKRWVLVNKPFQPEYLGDREWNRDAAQLAFHPSEDLDNLRFVTWQSLLDHCGASLDLAVSENEWAKSNGIKTGGEYLMLWIASIFQKPEEPLPYLFFYGKQGTGKTIFHEAISLLVTKGVARADAALVSQNGFNGELLSAVLCVVEESDLRQNRSTAYNRIKDWVTGKTISIHIKGTTPFSSVNTTHWVQCSNQVEACPIFPGDTRITMCHVDYVDPEKYLPKNQLLTLLNKEAPDFLAKILSIEIPESPERLLIPALETKDKERASELNESDLERFIKDQCFIVPGKHILLAEFHEKFQDWLDPERRHLWSKQKITRALPEGVVKGRLASASGKHFIGNLSFEKNEGPNLPPYIVKGENLVIG